MPGAIMLFIPLEVIAQWPKANLINPHKRGPELWIVSALFLSAATVCVSVRIWQRIFVRKWVGLDDLLIVLAYICTIGVSTTVGIGNAKYDWDRHIWDMPEYHYEPAAKVLYFSRIFWGLASSFVRLSVLCLFYRLCAASGAPRHFRWVLHCVTSFTVILLFYYLFSGIIPCMPISDYWAWPPPMDGKCINDGTSMQVAAVLNTFSEFVLATLPLLAVFRLRVDRRQRWSVIILLSLSFLVAFAGCFRTFYIWKVLITYDLTWWSGPQWICSEVEIDLALICACAAPLRPLCSRIARRLNGIPVHLNQVQRSLASSQNATIKGSMELDAEAVAEWTTRVSRAVDLEGIANDGLGYSVTVTGPVKKRSVISRMPFPRIGSISQRKASIGKVSQDTKTGLEIPVQREVAVRESWHSLKAQENGARWASYSSDGNIKFEKYEGENQNLEYLGDPSVLGPKDLAVPPQAVVVENQDGRGSIDGFMALPAMPWRTNSPPPPRVLHEVSARMDLLFPHNQRHDR